MKNDLKKKTPLRSWFRENGLNRALYESIAVKQALVDWIGKQSTRSFGLDRSIVLDLARKCGIDARQEKWILKKGPAYFGQNWSFELALFRELQLSGKAGEIAARLANK